MSSTSKKSNDSELWPLTTTNNPPMCTIDEEDVNLNEVEQKSNEKKRQKKRKTMIIDPDLLVNRYRLTQKDHREHINSSDDDDDIEPQSPFSPANNWQNEEEEEEDL